MRARQQAVVHRQLAREVEAAARGPDRVDVADDVGDRHVGRRELLDVALVATQPRDGRRLALLGDEIAAALAQGRLGVVVDLAPGHDRDRLVEERREGPEDAALRLAAQAEEDHVVPRENRVRDLRDDGVLVAEDAGEERFLRLEPAHEVAAHLLPDGDARRGTRRPELSEGAGTRH
ncbi:MAG: hypothetical protein U0599_14735 [Vicinamibacteria bacterium]